MNLVERHIDKIHALCTKHNVKRLFVFGSVTTSEFTNDSDVDLIVDFIDIDLHDYANNYFQLKYSLEKLLNREIDLLEEKAISNPYLKISIDNSKKLIYG